MSRSYDAFMRLDTSPYEGEFIGMCEGVLVAHSKSFEKVFEATRTACGDRCVRFVAQILPADCILVSASVYKEPRIKS